ncbi:MAG: DUF4384 domain-containing protein, partial [Gemmatimonadota bacterium]
MVRSSIDGRIIALVLVLAGAGILPPESARGQEYAREHGPLEARVWLDRGVDPVLRPGERTRIYYRVSEDAYIAIFQIDTNGGVRIAYPGSATDVHRARGERDYRLLFPDSPYWHVSDPPGVGYFFIVASPTPLDFSAFRYSARSGAWDLSRVGQQVYSDPYVAMDDYVALLIPDWEYQEYALDFSAYHVGQTYSYPRFLCYDCHGYQSFSSWNPYHYSCRSFRVVVYNDPYFYPSTRYRGSRVVYVRPPAPRQPQFVFKERAAGEPGTPVVQRRPQASGAAGRGAPTPLRSGDEAGGRGLTGETQRRGIVPERAEGRALPRPESGAPSRPSEAILRRWTGEGAAAPPRAGATGLPGVPTIPPVPGGAAERRAPVTGAPDAGAPARSPGAGSPSAPSVPPARANPRTPPPAATPPPATGERNRPVLERRPPPGTPSPPRARPSAPAPRGGSAQPPPSRSPSRPDANPPRSDAGPSRPDARPSG